jgi:hypothetical protein
VVGVLLRILEVAGSNVLLNRKVKTETDYTDKVYRVFSQFLQENVWIAP